MTITVSSVSLTGQMILMLSDRAITTTYVDEDGNTINVEYSKKVKYVSCPGVGCVTTWGRDTGNRLQTHLLTKNIRSPDYSVEELKREVYHYLKDVFRPHEYEDPEDVGYHVGGYDQAGQPKLYHLFWGCNRPPAPDEKPDYHEADHSVPSLLYNGRNDLADQLVLSFMEQIRTGQPLRYSPASLAGLIQICDFVGRFAAEMTPQVALPLDFNLIFPGNNIHVLQNFSFCPIEVDESMRELLNVFAP